MARLPLLVLRGATYHFRIRVPLSRCEIVGRAQLTRSLRTGSVIEAAPQRTPSQLDERALERFAPRHDADQAKVLVDQWLTAKFEEYAGHRDLPRRPVHNMVMFRRTEPWRADEVVETLDEDAFHKRFTQRVGDSGALPDYVSFGHKLSPQDIAKRGVAKLTREADARRRSDDDRVVRPTFKAWLEAQGVEADESDSQFRAGISFMLKTLADLGQASAARDEAAWYRWSGPDPAAGVYPGAEPLGAEPRSPLPPPSRALEPRNIDSRRLQPRRSPPSKRRRRPTMNGSARSRRRRRLYARSLAAEPWKLFSSVPGAACATMGLPLACMPPSLKSRTRSAAFGS